MRSDKKAPLFVLSNSPVEFVLVGPRGRHRGILLRSHNAGLDLVGAAADPFKNEPGPIFQRAALGILALGEAEVLAVRSHSFKNQTPLSEDTRASGYAFLWKGLANARQVGEIEAELSKRVSDLHQGILAADIDELEWHVAPIVTLCAHAMQKRRRLRIVSVLFLGLALLGYLVALWKFLL